MSFACSCSALWRLQAFHVNLASDCASETACISMVCKRAVPDYELILERMILPRKLRVDDALPRRTISWRGTTSCLRQWLPIARLHSKSRLKCAMAFVLAKLLSSSIFDGVSQCDCASISDTVAMKFYHCASTSHGCTRMVYEDPDSSSEAPSDK